MTLRLATVLARGGSKGVPGKNIRLIAGRPLIAHTVQQALDTGLFDAVAVSSDSAAILHAGDAAGATHLVRRPADMASDTAGKLPALRHCVHEIEAILGVTVTTVTDLQPTSPMRWPSDIAGAVAMQERLGVSNVVSGTPAKSSPYFNLVEQRADKTIGLSKPPAGRDITRRQDTPRCFDLNGAIYVWRRDALMHGAGLWFADTHLFEMPQERSLDIDTPLDFEVADYLMTRARS